MTSNQFLTTPVLFLAGLLTAIVGGGSAAAQEQSDSPYAAYYPLKNQTAASVVPQLNGLVAQLMPGEQVTIEAKPNKQVLVEGPAHAHQAIRKLLAKLDVPAKPPSRDVAKTPAAALKPLPDTRGQPAAKSVARVYPVKPGTAEALAANWRKMAGNRPDVRIAAIAQNDQVVVFAPSDFHAVIEGGPPVATMPPRAAPESAQPPVGTPRALPANPGVVESFVPIMRTGMDQTERAIRGILGSRLRPQPAPSTADHVYLLPIRGDGTLRITFDARRNGVMLQGPVRLVEQFSRLLKRLDTPAAADRTKRIIPLRRAAARKIREAVNAYRGGEGPPETTDGKAPEKGDGSSKRPIRSGQAQRRYSPSGVDLANYELVSQMFQPGGAAPAAQPPAAQGGPGGMAPMRRGLWYEEIEGPALSDLSGDLEVEILPDLDVVILQGRPRDVEAMTKIIEELERLSAETIPEIEVVNMRHTSGEAMAGIIAEVREDLIGGRQGRVSVIPLIKPDSLLLVGWGEAVAAIKELIDELDQPVSPESQFRVFPLKFASAVQVREDLMDFFNRDEGLAPRIEVVAETRTNSLIVRASGRDMAEVTRFIEKIDVDESGSVARVEIFKLKNSLADEIGGTLQSAIDAARGGGRSAKASVLELLAVDKKGETLVRSGLLADVNIVPDIRTNSLIVSAPAQSIPLLRALIERLDAPSVVAQIKVFQIVNADANNMVRTLQSLLPTQQAGLSSRPTLPVAEGESSLAPVRFAVDIRTNSIIATGSKGDLAIIEALLLRLDEKDIVQRETTVYRLRNAPAVDVATAISNFLRSERMIERAAPGEESPFRQIEREVVVVPELINNALIISATPRYFDEIMRVIEKLDENPPQVAIQVLIAEVRLDNTDEFGVELGLQDSLLFDRGLLSDIQKITKTDVVSTAEGIITVTEEQVLSADTTPGYNFIGESTGDNSSNASLAHRSDVAGQGTTSFALGRINSDLGYGGLTLSAGSDSVSVLLRALQECQRVNILSRPQIRTMDNQSAFIQVGQRVPRITGVVLNQTGMTQNIELEDVGLIMGVTPRISPEGNVVMELDAEKSELSETDSVPVAVQGGQVITSPSVNVTTAQTTVSARSGETIVLGGLIINGSNEIHRRVPWLSSIPVLGNLFRYDGVEKRRVELLIIMTPWIIRTPEDDEQFKQREAARMHWCLAEVNQVHGNTGLYDISGPVNGAACFEQSGQVVYPDAEGVVLPPKADSQGASPPATRTAPPLEAIPVPPPIRQSVPSGGTPPRREAPYVQPPIQSPSPRDGLMQPLPEPNLQGAMPPTRVMPGRAVPGQASPGRVVPAGYQREPQAVPAANPGGYPPYQYIPPTNRQ